MSDTRKYHSGAEDPVSPQKSFSALGGMGSGQILTCSGKGVSAPCDSVKDGCGTKTRENMFESVSVHGYDSKRSYGDAQVQNTTIYGRQGEK
ncbi:hypothetical protein RUND412_004463 [Rhizina undulata]